MGPRPNGRGKCHGAAAYRRDIRRQWGRGQTAAERVGLRTRPYGGDPRQWGRGQTAAERERAPSPWARGGGVNGAAAKRPRKGSDMLNLLIRIGRQWGRGQTAAESGRAWRAWPPNKRVNGAAAKRPRKVAGMSLLRHALCYKGRQWGRGQTAAERSTTTRTAGMRTRVNGAAAKRPRKVHAHDITRRSPLQRQWGRGQTAAERAQRIHESALCSRRQWGRGQTAAESAKPRGKPRRCRRASMGPRPNGRGKKTDTPDGSVWWQRQWGRGQTAAERRRTAQRTSAGSRRVNGAAAKRPRKGRRQGRRRPNPRASMGPRPNGRGKAAALARAAVRAWRQWGRGQTAAERLYQPFGRPRLLQRQWGRGQTAAESGDPKALACTILPASMGPRPNGRGKQPWPSPAMRVGSGVNGAAAKRPRKAGASAR